MIFRGRNRLFFGAVIISSLCCFLMVMNSDMMKHDDQLNLDNDMDDLHVQRVHKNKLIDQQVWPMKSAVTSVYENEKLECRKPPTLETNITMPIWKSLDFETDTKHDLHMLEEDDWPVDKRLEVIVIPHSHNDPAWLETFDSYYERATSRILNNMVVKLNRHQNMTFVWSEISLFARWWGDIKEEYRCVPTKISFWFRDRRVLSIYLLYL